uniref:hypothetical protein n=1 Tax=Oryzifoliimicrobium ureilyticus TaxID=3113724 RepID=UPI0030765ACD
MAGFRAFAKHRSSGQRYHHRVIIPFLVGFATGPQAAVFNFIAGVMPPMAMLGLSLLYVHS